MHIWMMQKNDLPKLEKFSYHVVHLKGKERWGLLVSLNFSKSCKALYHRQAASRGSDSLHMISGSEFVLETTHVTSSQIQYSYCEYWMNSCVSWWILILEKYYLCWKPVLLPVPYNWTWRSEKWSKPYWKYRLCLKVTRKKPINQFQPTIFIPVVLFCYVINCFSIILLFKGKVQFFFFFFFVWNIVFSQINNSHENC